MSTKSILKWLRGHDWCELATYDHNRSEFVLYERYDQKWYRFKTLRELRAFGGY